MWPLYRVKNPAKINKNIGEIFVLQYYGSLKELFNFNKFAKFIFLIILERYYFIMKHVTKYVASYFQIYIFFGTNIRIDVMNI